MGRTVKERIFTKPNFQIMNCKAIHESYGDQGAEEVNELFAKNVGLFAGGKLSQAAKDAYYRALTQAYLDCRAAAESEKKDSEN